MKPIFFLLAIAWGIPTVAGQAEQSAVELQRDPDLRDFDARGDARVLFELVAHAYGFECEFDPDYDAGKEIRFRMQDADYRTALHALGEATRSFVVPISEKKFLVANDTPEKRRAIEPYVEVMIDIPHATTPQEVTEAVTAVQQVIGIEKLAMQTQAHRVVMRGPESKVLPARAMFEELIHYSPQVSIEMKVLEVTRNDMLVYGFQLPTAFPIINFDSAAKVGTSLAKLGQESFAGMFGLVIASSLLVAQMEKLSGNSLLHFEVRSSNHQTATFHSGDRYPVLTSQYVGGTSSSSSDANGSNGSDSQTPAPDVFGNVAHPSAVAIADFNGDGFPDIAAAAEDGDAAAVLLGKGDGSFRDAVLYPTGKAPAAIAVLDANGDGIADLVTADSVSDSISLLVGKGDGTFREAVQFSVGARPVALAIADWNRDGFPDIATANTDSNDVSLLAGRGDGTFGAAQSLPVGTAPRALVAADFNRDGRPDLAVANFTSNNISILIGAGDGTFGAPTTMTTGQAPAAIASDDLNRDGNVDLVTADSTDNTVTVFIGEGTGAFAAGVAFPAGTGPVALAIADFNSDSAKDLAVANPDDKAVSVLFGLGNGSFQAPVAFHTGTSPDSLAVMDVNRDSLPDIVAANSATDNFSLLLGTAAGSFHDPSGSTLSPSGGTQYAPPPSFTFEDLGLLIKVTPHIHGTKEVTLDLDAEFKMLNGQGSGGLPVISNRKLATEVTIPNGQWAVIAGLLSTSEARTMTGFPIKALPAKRERDRGKTEVLILIKTNVLALPPEEFVAPPIPLGTETRPRALF